MSLVKEIKKWKGKEVLIIGEAIIDKYIIGYADRISPDAPVPNVKIEKSLHYLGGIGLTLQFIKSLGGNPRICTIVGNDYDGQFFLKKLKKLQIDSSRVLVDDTITTPQVTRIKAENQHLLRLESDYNIQISEELKKKYLESINATSKNVDSIVILDYGIGNLFDDLFIQNLINNLKNSFKDIPIIARPNSSNYYVYENIDLIKINLQKALRILSIDCCTETSITIVGKKILNNTRCKNVLLNYLESESYLFYKDIEKVEKIIPVLDIPVRSYVAIGSIVMAVLGLTYAARTPVLEGSKIALYGAALEATVPPIDFLSADLLINYISKIIEGDIL